MSGEKKEGNILVEKIIVPVVVAILVGGTAPWWWEKVFSGIKPVASLSSCPEKFTCDSGNKRPLPGYTRVNSGEDKVQWNPDSTHPDYNHIVASETEGFWKPEPGYKWASGKIQDSRRDGESNLEVRWNPDSIHPNYGHIVAAETEGFWKPEDGYVWDCGWKDERSFGDKDNNLNVITRISAPHYRLRICPSG